MRLDHPTQLALTHHWWAWNHPAIHKAMAMALVQACAGPIEETFSRNSEKGLQPMDFRELASTQFLRRDPDHLKRLLKDGGNQLSMQCLLGLATSLRNPLSSLLPQEAVVVADIALFLERRPVFSPDEALRYAQYRMHTDAANGHFPDRDALAKVAAVAKKSAPTEDAVLEKVLKVARMIGPILERIDAELTR